MHIFIEKEIIYMNTNSIELYNVLLFIFVECWIHLERKGKSDKQTRILQLFLKTCVLIDLNNVKEQGWIQDLFLIRPKQFTIFYDTVCSIPGNPVTWQSCNSTLRWPNHNGCCWWSVKTQSNHVTHTVRLPLFDDSDATSIGPYIDQSRQTFPTYNLNGEVINGLRPDFVRFGENLSNIPSVPNHVGGHTDFMIGIKYSRYFPGIQDAT